MTEGAKRETRKDLEVINNSNERQLESKETQENGNKSEWIRQGNKRSNDEQVCQGKPLNLLESLILAQDERWRRA